MKISTHLNFNGQCEEAFKFYEKCLGGKIEFLMTWGDSPMAKDAPKGWEKKVMHASFILGNQSLIGADSPPAHFEKPQGFAVTLSIDNPTQAEAVFKALVQNGRIQMEMQETFWAKRFGMAVDQFGIPWMINCSKQN